MEYINKKFLLAKRPQGMPQDDCWKFASNTLDTIKSGEIIIEVKFLSIDPYMRGRMNEGTFQCRSARRRSSETPTDPVDGASSTMSARIAGQSARHRAQLCQWRRPRAWPRPRSRVTAHLTTTPMTVESRPSEYVQRSIHGRLSTVPAL